MTQTKTVQFLELTKDGPRPLGTLTLTPENLIKAEPELGGDQALKTVMAEPVTFPDGTQVKREEDPEKWFNRLPFEYHGSYFWARFV